MKKHISKEKTQELLLNVVVLSKKVVNVKSLYLYDKVFQIGVTLHYHTHITRRFCCFNYYVTTLL